MHGCSADAAVTHSKLGESMVEEIRVARIGTLNFKNVDIDGKAFALNAQNPPHASMTLALSTSVILTVDAAAAATAEGTAELVLPSLLLSFFPLPSPLFFPLHLCFSDVRQMIFSLLQNLAPPNDDSCTLHRTYSTRLHVTRTESSS